MYFVKHWLEQIIITSNTFLCKCNNTYIIHQVVSFFRLYKTFVIQPLFYKMIVYLCCSLIVHDSINLRICNDVVHSEAEWQIKMTLTHIQNRVLHRFSSLSIHMIISMLTHTPCFSVNLIQWTCFQTADQVSMAICGLLKRSTCWGLGILYLICYHEWHHINVVC